jgi:hypothetical protein
MPRKAKKQEISETIEESLSLRPEQIVRYLTDNGKLPYDFNPYGQYMPEDMKFIGDTPPRNTRYYVGVNEEDEDIRPIYVSTPTPPMLALIDNYDLPQDDQYWRRLQIPIGLKKLEEKAFAAMYEVEKRNRQETVQGYKVYQKFWEILEDERDQYRDEIAWIKKIWWHRIYGYWLFNDGEPIYCTGEYFDYLNFWFIKDSETWVEFREEDRQISCFSQYLKTTTESFANVNTETGMAFKNENGGYDMMNIGSRVFYGDMKPKFRRCGETQWACHGIWLGCSTTPAAYGTIISMDGNNAEKHYYKKLIPAWNKYPLFLKPIWMGSKRPTSIKLIEPPNIFHIEGLGSNIDYAESGGVSTNDGDTMYFCLSDEEGKSVNPIAERWSVNKIAMSTGGGTNILHNAYAWHPSTVEDIGEGGSEYFKMWQLSNFYERIPIMGQTHSGLARVFIPAYKKLEGYIDRWGKSVINSPTERQIKFSPRSKFALTGKGAKDTLQAVLDSLLAKGTPEALEAYRSRKRKFPMKSADCWLGSSGNVGFNLEIIDRRLEELNRLKSLGKMNYKTGYFYREFGNPDDKVLWQTDIDNPKFRISLDPSYLATNQRIRSEVYNSLKGTYMPSWSPTNGNKFTCGVDMFRNLTPVQAKQGARFGGTSSNSRQSNGGIAILWEKDETIPDSNRCVLSYNYRPPTQMEFMEDVLMAAQYFGAMIYPEQNVERFIEFLFDRGYGGYALFDIDLMTGKVKSLPGKYTTNDVLQEIFREYKDYIQNHGEREEHDDLLMQMKNIRGVEDATHNDLFVAFGMCLLGSKSRYREILSNIGQENYVDLSGVFPKRAY